MKRIFSLLIAIIGTLSLIAQTPEAMTMVDADQVPQEVLKAMAKKYPKKPVVQWYQFDDIFTAKTELDSISRYTRFNREALLIEERLLKPWSSAPENLKSGKEKTEFKYWEVNEFYEIYKDGTLYHYFLELKNDKNEIKTIYFDTSGKLEAKSNSGR